MALLLTALGVIALLFVVLIYSSFSWGFVLFKFYGWFLIPVFTGLPLINYWQSVGLMFVVGLFCRFSGEGIKKEFKDEKTHLILGLLNPWITLIFGWIIFSLFVQ